MNGTFVPDLEGVPVLVNGRVVGIQTTLCDAVMPQAQPLMERTDEGTCFP